MERRRLADTLPTTHTRLFGDEPSPLHRISDFRLPNLSADTFDATAPSPTFSRTQHSFFGNKRALVRRHA
ncbi:hypothetical protein [Kingella oralis]|uniref:hypothetical protein n=1 Tax=Kingella oralis TaxID=505 RepID=UPI0034E4471D